MKRMKILNLANSIFLMVLASNLLYLYYSGTWNDARTLVEISEVVTLYIFIVLGTLGFLFNLWSLICEPASKDEFELEWK